MMSMVCSAISDMSRMPMMKVLGLSGLPVFQAGTGLLAAAAFGAGEAVEDVLPAEVLERLEPEGGASSSSRSIFGSSPRGASLRNQMFTKLV